MTEADLLGGYTEVELSMAFELVANPEHWKLPIDTTVSGKLTDEQLGLIAYAIEFYTGSKPTFRQVPGGPIEVRAAGYYAAVGA